jgi:mono/diheme cytochrome c family protein
VAIATPFGTVYGTNITPDRDTGIGTWSEAAFRRALRRGVDREGRELYPAFPYDHFTKLTDDDIGALYAYLMTREPVHAATPANDLRFPFDVRPLLAGWKLLYLREGPYQPEPGRSEAWNRGAYLAEGLGHCGACHTPRNRLGAEVASAHFAGGEAEGWWAPPLDRSSPAPLPWTADSLAAYLRGWEPRHGSAVGPMAPVVANLAQAPQHDVQAIAAYVAASIGPPSREREERTAALIAGPMSGGSTPPRRAADPTGEAIYAGACATCHDSGGEVPFTVPSLAQHTAIVAPDPGNLIRVVLGGVHPQAIEAGPIMPAFAGSFTEPQLAALVTYLRARFSDAPPWPNVAQAVHAVAARPGEE